MAPKGCNTLSLAGTPDLCLCRPKVVCIYRENLVYGFMCMDVLPVSLCIPERGCYRAQRRKLSLKRVNDLVTVVQTETVYLVPNHQCQMPYPIHCSGMLTLQHDLPWGKFESLPRETPGDFLTAGGLGLVQHQVVGSSSCSSLCLELPWNPWGRLHSHHPPLCPGTRERKALDLAFGGVKYLRDWAA